jgi:hypothetical protein
VTDPPPTPAERFATTLHWLSLAVVAMMGGERLPLKLIAQITDRLRRIKQRFATLAARIGDGRYTPRPRAGPPRRRPGQAPPPRSKLPRNFGWLLKLVPDAIGYRSQLENLLRDPEMAALIAAAPGPMAKTLRPLCRMLGLPPPPILALPPRARPATPPQKPRPPPTPTKRSLRHLANPFRVRYVLGLREPWPAAKPA